MKSIIIAGPSRAGKSTLAKLLNETLNCFVINEDKLVAVFQEAYPQLNIKLNWNRDKTTDNLAPFIAHFLGVFSSAGGRGLSQYSHGVTNANMFVLEGGYFNFDKITPILKTYGINALNDRFMLIGLAQNHKTVDEFIYDFRKFDTEDDWTYSLSDDALREVSEDAVSFSASMSAHLAKYGFTIYDTSKERERVLHKIAEDIKAIYAREGVIAK